MTIKDEKGNEVPYNSYMYKRIVQECYIISHQINTSYTDLMNVTPLERKYMWELVHEESESNRERLEKIEQRSRELEEKRNSRTR